VLGSSCSCCATDAESFQHRISSFDRVVPIAPSGKYNYKLMIRGFARCYLVPQ
jgi:hypothetical protein